jgi:hypothetical protein
MGGYILYKVFAVLLFALLLFSCTKTSNLSEKTLSIYSTFKNSAIYTATGDFDGDGKTESMFITQPDENYYITILYKNNILYKKLNHKADNLNVTIQDINNDNREDIILNIVQSNCENCYVYMVDSEINTILSPEIISANIDFQKVSDYIAYECGNFGLSDINNEVPKIKLYYTEMDYLGDEPVFISEGSVYIKNNNIFNIRAAVGIDEENNIVVKDINMFPVKN